MFDNNSLLRGHVKGPDFLLILWSTNNPSTAYCPYHTAIHLFRIILKYLSLEAIRSLLCFYPPPFAFLVHSRFKY